MPDFQERQRLERDTNYDLSGMSTSEGESFPPVVQGGFAALSLIRGQLVLRMLNRLR